MVPDTVPLTGEAMPIVGDSVSTVVSASAPELLTLIFLKKEMPLLPAAS